VIAALAFIVAVTVAAAPHAGRDAARLFGARVALNLSP
jgi:hypothetical protein